MRRSGSDTSGPRPARQRRGQVTLERIVAAAEATLAEDGPAALSVKTVMKRSGVGAGSFYARFAGREALLEHIQGRFWARCEGDLEELVATLRGERAPVSVFGPEVVRRLVRGFTHREADLRALMAEAIRHPDGPAMERAVRMGESLQLELRRALDPAGHREEELRVAILQVLGALRSLVLFPDESPFGPRFKDQDLILALSRTLLRAVGSGTSAPASYSELLRRSAGLGPIPASRSESR